MKTLHPIFQEILSDFCKNTNATARVVQEAKSSPHMRYGKSFQPILCADPASMNDEPMGAHVIGSRPNECFTCLRAQENCR